MKIKIIKVEKAHSLAVLSNAIELCDTDKSHRNRYNLFFTVKNKQLRISVYSINGVVHPFSKVCSEPNETGLFRKVKNFMTHCP